MKQLFEIKSAKQMEIFNQELTKIHKAGFTGKEAFQAALAIADLDEASAKPYSPLLYDPLGQRTTLEFRTLPYSLFTSFFVIFLELRRLLTPGLHQKQSIWHSLNPFSEPLLQSQSPSCLN